MPIDPCATYAVCVYVPEAASEKLKAAMFAAGGGRIGTYADCAWEVSGTGQFRPLPGSVPHTGRPGALERVPECRIEMLVPGSCAEALVAAVRRVHPYETPVCLLWPVTQQP